MSIAAEVVNCEVQTKNKYVLLFLPWKLCAVKKSKYVHVFARCSPSIASLPPCSSSTSSSDKLATCKLQTETNIPIVVV
jgi:hypothetical protein